MPEREFKLVENNEERDDSRVIELNSWDRQRNRDQILGFIARREARISELEKEEAA